METEALAIKVRHGKFIERTYRTPMLESERSTHLNARERIVIIHHHISVLADRSRALR
jgi:hypothetical protein